MAYDFNEKKALITGATKGIGRAIALQLASCGCAIAATGRNNAELGSLKKEIENHGGRCQTYNADLNSVEQTIAMAQASIKTFGEFDFIVNNAGISFPETMSNISTEHWDATLNVNLRAPALISHIITPGMIQRKSGSIVNVSSVAGVVGLTEHAAYCASKFGLNGLTKVMALELGEHNIRVNAIAPTVVLTPMGRQVWGEEHKAAQMRNKIPLGRFAEVSDVVALVLFLLSDDAAMINGQIIAVDGGFSAQ